MKIKEIGMCTLLGIGDDKFPIQFGNCFNVRCDDGHYYHVANLDYENFEELIKRELIPLECEVEEYNETTVTINGLPEGWEKKKYCSGCCEKSKDQYIELENIMDEVRKKRGLI